MVMRTYGLSGSGMDVDQMVTNLMKAQKTRYDSIAQKKTQAEWKKADYNTMYNTISDFRNTVFNYTLDATTSPKKANSSDETVVSASAIADAANISHRIEVTQMAAGVNLTSSDKITTGVGENAKATLANQFGITSEFKIKIGNDTASKVITVKPTESIYDLVSDINNAGVNIKASYDATMDRFFMSTTGSGATVGINFSGSDSAGIDFLRDKLKISVDADANKGKDAKFKLDSSSIELSQASNTFTISGVTYNIKKLGSANIDISPDKDKTIANVVSFVEAYNKTLKAVYSELNETKYKDYLPLTSEQKKAMSEADIKAWDEKAKSGSLRRDSTLKMTVESMRNYVASPVSGISGKYNSLSSIGITTGTYTENGQLHINETKLKEALEADPDIANKLFTAQGDTVATKGVANRIYDTLKTSMDKIVTEAGLSAGVSDDTKSTLAKLINGYTDQLYDLNKRMASMEDRYYKQFDAMEVALNNLNKQSSWLSQQLGSS